MARRLVSSGSTFEEEIGYSRAVIDDEWVFVSGTTGFDYATMTISETSPTRRSSACGISSRRSEKLGRAWTMSYE